MSCRHIALLEIYQEQFRLKPIPLKTIRPFILEDVVLSGEDLDPDDQEAVIQFLTEKVYSFTLI